MGLFDNAESRVVRHTSGMNKNVRFNEYGKKIFNIPEKETHENVEEGLISKIIQGPETVKEELPEYEKRFREMNMQKTIKENTNKNFLQSLGNKTKLCVLENVLSSIYYDALYLDDEFKEYNKNIITESVHKFLDERGGYKYIQEAYYKNKSPLLKEIMRICEETSNDINKRKIEESKNAEDLGQNLFNFNMTSEEEKKLDYSKEQIGLKQVSNVIKEKVLNVVKEEKKRESEHEELLTEIENELSENPDVNNPEAVAEALNKIFIGNINIEEGTLFNSLLRYDLKSVIESGYESLDLIKEENCEDDNELNNMSLESIISEAEERNYNDEEIYNDKMKDLFDDFIEKVEEGCNFGKTDEESIIYAFESTESKMDEIVNNTLDFNELIDIRRDFRLMQNVIEAHLLNNDFDNTDEIDEDFDINEEGVISAVGEKTKNLVFKLTDKQVELLWRAICKCYKDPKKLRRIIADSKDEIRVIEKELKNREKETEIDKERLLKQASCYAFSPVGMSILTTNVTLAPKDMLTQTKRYNDIYIRLCTKRLNELKENPKKQRTLKEKVKNVVSREGVDESILEDLEFIEDELDDDLFDVEEGCSKKKKCKEGCDKEDDDDNKCEEGCGTSKCKEGKCSTKEGCGTSKCKEGCGTSKCKEGCSTSKCKEGKCSTKEGCGTSKCKEGCGTSKCKEGKCSTKEGDLSIKTIDTTFENYEIENIINEMDYDELFERNEDFVDEAYNSTTVSYAFKNLATIFSNMFKAKKDINQIQPGLLKMVERCKTIQDIDALNKDLNVGLKQVKNMKDNCKDPEKKKQYEQHLKWLQTTYRDAIRKKN